MPTALVVTEEVPSFRFELSALGPRQPRRDDIGDVEGELVAGRERVGGEPSELGHVVGGDGLSRGDVRAPVEVERRPARSILAVPVDPYADELLRLDLQRRLLAQLAPDRVERVLVLVDEAAREVPAPGEGRSGAARQQDSSAVVQAEGTGGRRRVRVGDEPARWARRPAGLDLELRSAARTVDPPLERRHLARIEP